MSIELYNTLVADCVLAFLLLILFVYLSKISNGVSGIARWGIGHFIFSLGAVLIDGASLPAVKQLSLTPYLLMLATMLSCAGLILLGFAITAFSQEENIPNRYIAYSIAACCLLIFLTLPLSESNNANGLVISIAEVTFLLVMIVSLSKIKTPIIKLPAQLMLISGIPLIYTYCVDIVESINLKYNMTNEWIYFDLTLWFFLNFCMLMMASFKAAEGYRQAALQDPLTGALNRRGLRESIDNRNRDLNKKNVGMAVIAFDLDYFKAVNDTYSHEAGDLVLESISEKVNLCLEDDDVFARIGGEEFIVVVWGKKAQNANILAECIRQEIANSNVKYKDEAIKITASFGSAYCPTSCKFPTLMQQADAQLYMAKQNGRNQVKSCIVRMPPHLSLCRWLS